MIQRLCGTFFSRPVSLVYSAGLYNIPTHTYIFNKWKRRQEQTEKYAQIQIQCSHDQKLQKRKERKKPKTKDKAKKRKGIQKASLQVFVGLESAMFETLNANQKLKQTHSSLQKEGKKKEKENGKKNGKNAHLSTLT